MTANRSSGVARRALAAMVLVAGVLIGCQAEPKFEYEPFQLEDVDRLNVMAVPMIRQTGPRACGAAALEMVLTYYGKPVSQDEIMKALDHGEPGGLAAKDMKAFVERQGLFAFNVHGNAEDIFTYIDRRIPLIVARRSKFPKGLGNHYMVLTGRSRDQEYVAVNDPDKGRVKIRLERFLADWSAAQRFAMIIAPRAEPVRSRPSEAP